MRLNSSKNLKLIKQYPFLKEILCARMEPFDGIGGLSINDLTIKVEKADGNLMYRRAENIGLGEASWMFQENRRNQVGRQGEYIFAVDSHNNVVNRVDWPRNKEVRHKGDFYAWAVLWMSKDDRGHCSRPIFEQVEFLVWATVEAWHIDTNNDDKPDVRFGAFHDRLVHITIYGKPKQGFHKLQEESNIYENLTLDSHVITKGVIEHDHGVISMGGMLYEMCIMFQDEVYFNGMKDILDAGEYRGASGQFGSVEVLAAEMCGYDRVTLKDSISYVTFQLRPGSKNMQVHGQDGTLPQIRNLVRTVVRIWNQKPELQKLFKPNQNVSVM